MTVDFIILTAVLVGLGGTVLWILNNSTSNLATLLAERIAEIEFKD
ncbi:hypothetical protein [Rhodovulum adriaticum]|nr:hypothetical protein [Rhodovulum adriaticum]